MLRRVGEERAILDTIIKRKTNWIGEILSTNCLLHDSIEGIIEGLKRIGRTRMQLIDDIKDKRKYWELKSGVNSMENK